MHIYNIFNDCVGLTYGWVYFKKNVNDKKTSRLFHGKLQINFKKNRKKNSDLNL